jgi:hypothetical protein
MHPLKAINEKMQTMQRQCEAQSVPLNVVQVAQLCIEYTNALTAVLDGLGALPDPVEPEAGA